MMNLLWPREGLHRQMFYDYWSGAHTQISSRLPGIHQYFQHHLDPEGGLTFPGAQELIRSSDKHPGFFGDAEITFRTEGDLAAFAEALAPLMQDEQNVFQKTISYQATGANVRTVQDRTDDDSPNGDLGRQEKYLLYLRRSVSEADFRRELEALAEDLAGSRDVQRVRYRFVDLYDNDAVTLLAPNVSNFEDEAQQVHGCLEIIFGDALARRRYGSSDYQQRSTQTLRRISRDVFPTRALRTFTVYNHGRITLAGLRTPQMAAQIAEIGAINQTSPDVEALLLNAHTQASVART